MTKFTVTAWAMTALIGLTTLAHADPAKRNWWIEGGAQFLFWDGTRNLIGDGVGSIEPDDGYGLFLEGGYHQPDGPWSASFGAKYGESGNSKESVNSVSSGGLIFLGTDTTNEEEFIRLDAMAGYDVDPATLPDAEVRIIGGIRFLHFDVDENGTVRDSISGLTGPDRTDRKFTGAGPRLGVETTIPLNEKAALELDAAGALLLGERRFKKDLTVLSGGTVVLNDNTSRTKTIVVPNIELFAGLSYTFSEYSLKVTGGYSVDAYFNLVDAGCRCFFKGGDRVFHGPTLRAKIPF